MAGATEAIGNRPTTLDPFGRAGNLQVPNWSVAGMHLEQPDEDDPAYQGGDDRQQSCQPCAAPFYETVLCPPSTAARPSEQYGDDDQHCHGKQIRHGTSPGHIEQSKAGKDQPLSSAARQTGSANGNLQLEKYGAITIPGLLSYKRNLRHSRPNDRRRADVEGPPLCRLAASHLVLEHARLGRRSKGADSDFRARIACRAPDRVDLRVHPRPQGPDTLLRPRQRSPREPAQMSRPQR